MSGTDHRDTEGGGNGQGNERSRYVLLIDLTPSSPILNVYITMNRQLQERLNFGDSSESFFSVYSKTADDEDNKTVDRWQKDAKGVLIFVSPFVRIHLYYSHKLEYYRPVYSLPAALVALLAVTVQDLRPSS